jgi:hypothetical protein
MTYYLIVLIMVGTFDPIVIQLAPFNSYEECTSVQSSLKEKNPNVFFSCFHMKHT